MFFYTENVCHVLHHAPRATSLPPTVAVCEACVHSGGAILPGKVRFEEINTIPFCC